MDKNIIVIISTLIGLPAKLYTMSCIYLPEALPLPELEPLPLPETNPLPLPETNPLPLPVDVFGTYHWRSEYRKITNEEEEFVAITT